MHFRLSKVAMKLLNLGHGHGTQRAKFAKKVHKPPLGVNVIDFEINVFNTSRWVPWSPSDSKISRDALIEVFKFISKNFECFSPVRSNLRFVNLLYKVSRVCGRAIF